MTTLLPLERKRLTEELTQQILDGTAYGPQVCTYRLINLCNDALAVLEGSIVFGARVALIRRLLVACAIDTLREYAFLTLQRGNKAAKALQALEAQLKPPAEVAA